LTDDFIAKVDLAKPQEWFCELYEEANCQHELTRAQRHDMRTYLPDDLLVKTDMASMANSLELRAPMLDHEVAALGLSLPPEMKVGKRFGKVILRQSFADLLPRETLRRPKRGFGIPLSRWLREDMRGLMVDTLMDRGLERRGILRRQAVAGLVNDHLAGRDDHGHRLWALLVLARWLASSGSD
jgi:asparagine synthase (glutamine-hydrolysing)